MILWILSSLVLGCTGGSDYNADYILLPEHRLTPSTPSFIPAHSPNISVSVGERAVLNCRINHATMNTVSWVRVCDGGAGPGKAGGAPELLAVGRFVFSPDGRLSVAQVQHTQDYMLIIQRATLQDSGWYECQLNTDPHTSHGVHLSVVEPSSLVEGEKEVYVDGGSSHSITCRVQSPSPPHHIFWYFNGQPLTPGSDIRLEDHLNPGMSWSRLNIDRVSTKHTGRFECRPSNSQPSSINLMVIIGNPPAELQPPVTSSSDQSINQAVYFLIILAVSGILV